MHTQSLLSGYAPEVTETDKAWFWMLNKHTHKEEENVLNIKN